MIPLPIGKDCHSSPCLQGCRSRLSGLQFSSLPVPAPLPLNCGKWSGVCLAQWRTAGCVHQATLVAASRLKQMVYLAIDWIGAVDRHCSKVMVAFLGVPCSECLALHALACHAGESLPGVPVLFWERPGIALWTLIWTCELVVRASLDDIFQVAEQYLLFFFTTSAKAAMSSVFSAV